jgi:uncharacterized protein YegP (UPF0339 family)
MRNRIHFEIYRTPFRLYRWRLRAANGEIIAHGEAYLRKKSCYRAISIIQTEVDTHTLIQDLTK